MLADERDGIGGGVGDVGGGWDIIDGGICP